MLAILITMRQVGYQNVQKKQANNYYSMHSCIQFMVWNLWGSFRYAVLLFVYTLDNFSIVYHQDNTKEYSYLLMQQASFILNNNSMKSQNFNPFSSETNIHVEHAGFPPVVTFLSHFYLKIK